MRFGSCERFAIEIQPGRPTWDHVAPDDRGPWAEWTLWVGGEPLTRHQLPGEDRLRNGVYLPLLPLVRWFRAVWWAVSWEQRAPGYPSGVALPTDYVAWGELILATDDDEAADRRDGWWERHFLPAADTGAWLPMVTFVRAEQDLWVSWQPHRPAGERAPTFLQPAGTFAVDWNEVSQIVDEFCQAVVAMHPALDLVLEPTSGPPAPGDVLAWLTGAPVDLLAELARQLLKKPPDQVALTDIEGSVGLQASRDIVWDERAVALLEQLEQGASQPMAHAARLAEAREIGLLAGHWYLPEKEGAQAARALRERCDLGTAQLPADIGSWLDETFGIRLEHQPWPGSDNQMVAGARDGTGAVILTLENERPKKEWEKRAEAVRGLGHLLLDAPTARGVRGAAFSPMAEGPRKRRAGAFMAELLVPTSALEARFRGLHGRATMRAAFQQLMADYGVGARLAAWHLYHRRYLPSREAVQELIDDFAAL